MVMLQTPPVLTYGMTGIGVYFIKNCTIELRALNETAFKVEVEFSEGLVPGQVVFSFSVPFITDISWMACPDGLVLEKDEEPKKDDPPKVTLSPRELLKRGRTPSPPSPPTEH